MSLEQDAKPRTISDLANHLGVSSMTIHRAIAGKPDIASSTRARILAEIERLGWRPNMAARGLRKGKTYTLGILLSHVAASFLPEILHGLDLAAEREGYHTFICVHEHVLERAERHLYSMRTKGMDGIVYYPTIGSTEGPLLNEVLSTTPVVAIMRELPGFNGPCLLVDDELGGRMAARHLLELGHQSVGFLGYQDSGFTRERFAGFQQAMNQAGVSLRPEWLIADLNTGDESVTAATVQLLSQRERPTALFCASDRLAARAMQAALSLGMRVPEELSIIGFNGDSWGSLLAVPLTTIAQPRVALGEQAAEIVLNGATTSVGSQRIVLEPVLVRQRSTAPPQRR